MKKQTWRIVTAVVVFCSGLGLPGTAFARRAGDYIVVLKDGIRRFVL